LHSTLFERGGESLAQPLVDREVGDAIRIDDSTGVS
jgi:hypothetical protein